MFLAVVCGLVFGLGVRVLGLAVRPPLPNLTALVERQVVGISTQSRLETRTFEGGLIGRLDRRFGDVLLQLAATLGLHRPNPAREADLRIIGSSPQRLMTERVATGLVGFVVPLNTAVLAGAGGVTLPGSLVASLAALLAALGVWAPGTIVRERAQRRRATFRHALSAFLDLVAISVAGGGRLNEALEEAAASGRGWAFELLSRPLRLRQQFGAPPWDEFALLGRRLAVPELEDLATTMALIGTEGAAVQRSLSAKAESLRARRLTDAEEAAGSAVEQLALPMTLLGLGFLLFIGYPAVLRVLSGLD